MLLTKKIKLEVSEQDAATLEFMQGKCRGLYNFWVMRLRDGERWPGAYAAKKTLKESREFDPDLSGVYNKLLQEVYFRLDKAMKAFFRRVEAGEKPGFPRVRPRHCFFTLCYPAMYMRLENGVLILPTGGRGKNKKYPDVRARLTEEAPAEFGEVAISRDAQGNYSASFSHEVEPHEGASQEDAQAPEVVAFDLGIKRLATGVNEQGRVYTIGGYNKGKRWYNRQLDKIRSKRDKCKKKSRRYLRLTKVYSRVSAKKRNKQQDSLHKASHLIAHRLVERTVVVGDLSQRQMVMKEHEERNKQLNRAVYNDWGLYTFLQMLTYKCQLSGKELVILDERDTSKLCSGCGNKQPMPLYKRTYRCPKCGLCMDRDENSACNIRDRYLTSLTIFVAWYLAWLRPHTLSCEQEECGVLQATDLEVASMGLAPIGQVQQLKLW
ncbi:MAG TPA: transposase [Ktedonobacteraceae bacterium]|nr:transposase [Ktedonobacteraceae bacterium]